MELIEQLAQKLEAAAEALAAEQKLAFVTPVLATHVPYDMECQQRDRTVSGVHGGDDVEVRRHAELVPE